MENMERRDCESGLYQWNIYHEPADTLELAKFIGTVMADTMALAIDHAAQYYEIPPYDLIAKRSDLDRLPEGGMQ